MYHKCYDSEIILALLKAPNHIRSLAKDLDTNPMNVQRKLIDLLERNIVDFRPDGKNKTFFLKKTAEARMNVYAAEQYKLIHRIHQYPQLRQIIEKIQNDSRVELAIIFGSYAKAIPKKDSDIDIYIETKNQSIKKELSLIDSKLSIKIGEYDPDNLLIKEIEKNHIIMKGVEKFYGKNKFFD